MDEHRFTGICCECQSVHTVRCNHKGYRFLMDMHDAFGQHCNGSLTVPQVTFKDGKQVTEKDDIEEWE